MRVQNAIEEEIAKNAPEKSQKVKCDHCEKFYSSKSNLVVHINTIHKKIFPYKCEFEGCSKSYPNLKRKNIHMRTHLNLRPFECEICKKKFNEKIILKNHMLSHSETREFKCELCNKSYKTKYHLQEHVNVKHLKIKNFECEICGKKFGKKFILKVHFKTHCKENSKDLNYKEEENSKNEESSVTEQSSEELSAKDDKEDIYIKVMNEVFDWKKYSNGFSNTIDTFQDDSNFGKYDD